MKFIPFNKQCLTERAKNKETSAFDFSYDSKEDLTVVKILDKSSSSDEEILVNSYAIVITTLIQVVKFGDESWEVIPDSAILGFLRDNA
jgi:hypothetical protein